VGHCIPIDPFYLTWKAREYGHHTRFIELAGEINNSMPHYVIHRTIDGLNEVGKALRGSKVLVIGLAYKPDVDDVRETPAAEIIKLLFEHGADVELPRSARAAVRRHAQVHGVPHALRRRSPQGERQGRGLRADRHQPRQRGLEGDRRPRVVGGRFAQCAGLAAAYPGQVSAGLIDSRGVTAARMPLAPRAPFHHRDPAGPRDPRRAR
jgi:hypothetical protein